MIDSLVKSLLIREIVAEGRHKDILKFLVTRFGPVPSELEVEVKSILDETVLDAAVELAAACPDLGHFAAESGRSPASRAVGPGGRARAHGLRRTIVTRSGRCETSPAPARRGEGCEPWDWN